MIPENQKLIRLRDKSDGGEMTCIICPIGCRLTIQVMPEKSDDSSEKQIQVSGNQCKRGEAYAKEEFSDPRRVVTATCAVDSQTQGRIPVKSSKPVPVEKVTQFLNVIYKQRLSAPVNCGDVLVRDVAGTGIELLATQSIEH